MSNEGGINLQQDLINNFDIINKGIRPEGMEYNTFKYYNQCWVGFSVAALNSRNLWYWLSKMSI